jgi:quercetin dioxygenase-like cupin family protein
MKVEELVRRNNTLVRRLKLEPGEAMPWHRDPFHRITVVLHGDVLAIEFRNRDQPEKFLVTSGEADWDEPSDVVHRAVNVGQQTYEEITVFFLDHPNAVAHQKS